MRKGFKRILAILLSGMLVIPMLMTPAEAMEVLQVTQVTCEHKVNPMGIDTLKPTFGWKMESQQRDVLQKSYRVLVSTSLDKLNEDNGDMWDSGVVESQNSTAVVYAGRDFAAQTVYYWKVKVTDNKGNQAQSEPATFETAMLSDADWNGAQWITADGAEDNGVYYVYEADFEIVNGAASFVFGYQDGQNFYMWQVGKANGKPALRPHIWWKGNIWCLGEVDISGIISNDAFSGTKRHIKMEVNCKMKLDT